MKLALIRRHFSAIGGAELYLQRLLAALAGENHELHVFTEAWPQAPPGVIVHPITVSGSRADCARRFAEAARMETARQRFDCVFSLDRTLQQDVYRAGDGVHRVWLERRRQFASRWRRPFTGWGGFHKTMLELEARTFDPQNTRHIIANSEMVRREILDHFRFPAERIHVVPNGVDVSRFQRGERNATRARFGVGDDELLLLFVGSGWERKGLRFLLRAMFRCENRARDWVEGFRTGLEQARASAARRTAASGDLEGRKLGQRNLKLGSAFTAHPSCGHPLPIGWGEGRVRGALNKLGDILTGFRSPEANPSERIKLLIVGKGRKPFHCTRNAIFAGPMADVENAYAAADLFVFLPIYEPSANVVFEALAAGLPVVTTRMNGASELIQEDLNGTVIADPSDVGRVAQAIGFWSSCPVDAANTGLERLSLDRNVRETLAILELAANEKSR